MVRAGKRYVRKELTHRVLKAGYSEEEQAYNSRITLLGSMAGK